MANCNITCLYYYDTIRPDWTSYRNRKQKVELGIPVITKAFGGMTSHAGTKTPFVCPLLASSREGQGMWASIKQRKKKRIVKRQFPHGLVLRYLPFFSHDHPALWRQVLKPGHV